MTQELADEIMAEKPIEVRGESATDTESGADLAYRRLMRRMDEDLALLLRAGIDFVRLELEHQQFPPPPVVHSVELFVNRDDGRRLIVRYEVTLEGVENWIE